MPEYHDLARASWARLYADVSLVARSPSSGHRAAARALADAQSKWHRVRDQDPVSWTYRRAVELLPSSVDPWDALDDPLSERLSQVDRSVLAALVPYVRHDASIDAVAALLAVDEAEVVRRLDAAAEAFGAGDASDLRRRLAWPLDAEVRSLPPASYDEAAIRAASRGSGLRRWAIAGAGFAVVAVLVGLALTQRTIVRPDLIQLLPTGLERVDADGNRVRLLEEQIAVAKINRDGAILYQYDGRAGLPEASIWYRPSPEARSTQVFPLTGGIVGWVEGAVPARAVVVTSDVSSSDGASTTTVALGMLDPESGSLEPLTEIGRYESRAGEIVAGSKPVAVAYGGERILVWTADAVLIDSLPTVDADSCGRLLLLDLSGRAVDVALPPPSCDADGRTMSAPAVGPDGTTLAWIEAEGTVDPAIPPREGWLSSVTVRLVTHDLAAGRSQTYELTTFERPSWWTQYTLFSEATGTLAVDLEGTTAIASVGIWDPAIEAATYSVFLVDTIGERVERSVGEGLVTFGR